MLIIFITAEATISYDKKDKQITFIHTNVPKEFQGKGVGKLLAQVSTMSYY